MTTPPLFTRFEQAIKESGRLQDELTAAYARGRLSIVQSARIGRDLELIAAATFQRRQAARTTARNFGDHVAAHLQAVACVHHRLAAGEERIPFGDYAQEVCRNLPPPDYDDPNIRLEFDADGIHLDADRAIPLGMITTELVMNAYRHAFKTRRAGTIRVAAKGHGDSLASFSVTDTGPGFPADFSRGSGVLIVETLADAIGGKVTFSEGPYAAVLLSFSKEHRPRA